MKKTKYQNNYRVSSSRAIWHDYNGGIYFVTICTKDRVHYFGNIETFQETSLQPIMKLTKIGLYADEQLKNIQKHYPYAEIPLWVVMPNHIHAVVVIDGSKTPYDKRNVETFPETSLQKSVEVATKMQSWLSIVIRQFKQSITRFARQNNVPFAWQSRFYDRIIRKTDDMNLIAEYIENNVVRWEFDELHE